MKTGDFHAERKERTGQQELIRHENICCLCLLLFIRYSTKIKLRAYPRTLWEGASGRGILNNKKVLGRALNNPNEKEESPQRTPRAQRFLPRIVFSVCSVSSVVKFLVCLSVEFLRHEPNLCQLKKNLKDSPEGEGFKTIVRTVNGVILKILFARSTCVCSAVSASLRDSSFFKYFIAIG